MAVVSTWMEVRQIDTPDIDGHRVHSKSLVLDRGKPGRTNHSCMYGGGLGAIDHDYIYDCKQCSGLASSSICARCLINGGTCEPDHNAWELVTWKLFSWTADILLIYQRPTFHSWIPEWRTIFFHFIFIFIFINMGSCVCCYMYHGSLQ